MSDLPHPSSTAAPDPRRAPEPGPAGEVDPAPSADATARRSHGRGPGDPTATAYTTASLDDSSDRTLDTGHPRDASDAVGSGDGDLVSFPPDNGRGSDDSVSRDEPSPGAPAGADEAPTSKTSAPGGVDSAKGPAQAPDDAASRSPAPSDGPRASDSASEPDDGAVRSSTTSQLGGVQLAKGPAHPYDGAGSLPANPSDGPPASGQATEPAAGAVRSGLSRAGALVGALVLLGLLVVLSIAAGARNIPIGEVISALADNTGQGDAHVIWNMRVPRTVAGLAVGLALGTAGALIQALTRNPLADPGILGVNAGAAFAVALGVAAFGVTSIRGQVWFAFAGALVVTVVVYLIGSAGRGGADPVQLTLAGVALGAVLSGLVSGMVLLDPRTFDSMRGWSAGSIVGRDVDLVAQVAPFLVIGLVLAAAVAPTLNSIALGDDVARALGARIALARGVVVVAVTLLAGGATAIAGPIAFVGLMVPHVARWIVGPDQRWILATTVALGPALVLAADIVGRVVIRPGEIPVGIMTAFVGAPLLIHLVRRHRASTL